MSRRPSTGQLRVRLVAILGPGVAEEFIAVAEQQTGKPVSRMTASDIDTARLQKELEAIEARHWLRAKRLNSLGELVSETRPLKKRSRNTGDAPGAS